jgi:5S rRNA maturation endonuclease (ribonuclease M5)
MLDFLSLLAIMKLQQLEGDAIIMHSLSSYQKTATAVQVGKYQTVNLFLDNDQSGVDVAFRFQQEIPNTVNQAQLFHPHKDLNEYLRESSNVIEKERSTKPQRKQTVGKSENQVTKLKEAKVLEAKLQEQLREQTEEICRTVFRKYPGAKAKAFEEAKHRSGSGYRADRSIAMNMADIRFRDVFKRIVQEQYPEAFKEVEELAIEVSRLQQLIEELT